MFALTSSQILTIIISTILFYALIIAFTYAKRHWMNIGKPVTAQASVSGHVLLGAAVTHPQPEISSYYPEPADHSNEFEDDDDSEAPFIPDEDIPFLEEQPITLLKEAERVVEQIQLVVDHIASHPANPEEVFTKIQAIVCEYTFFFDTEYYEAINRFVAVTVQRDCDLLLSEEDLRALWLPANVS